MHLKIFSVGTRGDTQPVIALGKALQAEGYEVSLIVGENFAEWVESHGLKAAPISTNIQALMNTPEGLKWMEGGSASQQFRYMIKLMGDFGPKMALEGWHQAQGADALLASFTTESFAESAAEKLGIPFIRLPLQPLDPSRHGPSNLVAPFRNSHSRINGLAGQLIHWMLHKRLFAPMVNDLRVHHFNLPPLTAREIGKRLHHAPTLGGYSEHVVPYPDDWPENIHITGYWFLDEQNGWTPPEDFEAFLAAGEMPVYFGFGSMSSDKSTESTRMIYEVVQRLGIRAVIQSGWAGLGSDDRPEHVYLLGNAPHDYLFPRMKAVVHHGGAGTTAAGLRAGKPTVTVPHINEQEFWGERVKALGVGTNAGYRSKLTAAKLVDALTVALKPETQARAAAIGEKIRSEEGISAAVHLINHYLRGTPKHNAPQQSAPQR